MRRCSPSQRQPFKVNCNFPLTERKPARTYNQTIYGKKKSEHRPLARHAGHVGPENPLAPTLAWVAITQFIQQLSDDLPAGGNISRKNPRVTAWSMER
jgi:hypothetical protein